MEEQPILRKRGRPKGSKNKRIDQVEAQVVPGDRLATGRKAKQAELQNEVLSLLGQGFSVREAMSRVDRSQSTFQQWQFKSPEFAERVQRVRARLERVGEKVLTGDFASWRQKYLDMETFVHQQQWVDIFEGREPFGISEQFTYLPGRDNRVIINTPPEHAKTTTITVDYVVYRICRDPNVRIIIISESKTMAMKMLVAIKERLTNPRYEQMHLDFGPQGGFRVGAAQWSQTRIYVGGRDSGEKDPTVEVLGVGSQIYGARADLIIADDCVTLKTARTAGQSDRVVQWLDQEVSSRLGPKGMLALVGTRVSTNDVYAKLLKRDEEKPTERRVWTYLSQPAVLEYADDPKDWVTLWPWYWPGEALASRRDEMEAGTWSLVYQQQQVAEDAVFPEEAVAACMYHGSAGPLTGDFPRAGGMQGLGVVVGLDPAGSGYTAIVVLGVDRGTGTRYVLEVVNRKGMAPFALREEVARICQRYKPQEWRIEKNGLQTIISQDDQIRTIIQRHGGRVSEHHTGTNKWDVGFGVGSLAPLFLSSQLVPPKPGILIPDNGTNKGIRALVDQLITWEPDTRGKTDAVMALWFADLAARNMLTAGSATTYVPNRWQTRGQKQRQHVVNIEELIAEQSRAQVLA